MIIKGFEPIFYTDSKVLILGSFPSVISRENNFYYGFSKNRFWKTLSYIYNDEIENTIDSKIAFLKKHHIALWDIVNTCEIIGSSDNNIRNYTISDIHIILNNSKIIKILCNGRKAYDLTNRFYKKLEIPIIYLSSTSTANTKFDISQWIDNLEEFVKKQ